MRRFNTQAELDGINRRIADKSRKLYYFSKTIKPYKSWWYSRRCSDRKSPISLNMAKELDLFYSLKHPGNGIKVVYLDC